MREILFRGKRIDNGEWLEGDLIHAPDGRAAISTVDDLLEVQHETVCQYTGLTDKGSRKIWENDIIRYNKKLFRVAWKADCTHFAAYPLDKEIRYAPCLNIGTMKSVEVVGNIFDNPELLN